MEISEIKKGHVMVVEIKGKVDSTNFDILQKQLTHLTDIEERILIDCTDLDYISSAGLGVLLVALKAMRQKGGDLLLCSLNERIKEVFVISGFSKIFPIKSSRQEVLDT